MAERKQPGKPPGIDRASTDRAKERSREREGSVATEERRETQRPRRYKVILFNDDYTPMEFVVMVLEQIFAKPPTEATQIMLRIHNGGQGVAGVYVQEIAETKVATVHRLAEARGYPLRAGAEEE